MTQFSELQPQVEAELETYLHSLGELPEEVKNLFRQLRSDQLRLERENQALRQRLGEQEVSQASENVIQERLQLLETVMAWIHEAVMITETDEVEPPFRILYVNEAFSQITGYPAEEVLGQTPQLLQGPDTDQQALKQIRQTLSRRQAVQAELINYRKDGTPFWMEMAISPVFDQAGHCTHFIAIQRDISERKQAEQELYRHRDHLDELVQGRTAELAQVIEQLRQEVLERRRVEEALRRSEARYNVAQQAANVGIWEREVATGELYWSEQTEAIFGFRPGGFPGTFEAFLACVHPEDRPALIAATQANINGGREYVFEHRIIRPDGTIRWVLERGNAVRDFQGQPLRFTGVVQDITERKEAARALQQSHRQERYLRQVADSLREVAMILNSSLDLEDVLAKIFTQLGRVVQYDGGAIFLMDGEDLRLIKGIGQVAQRHQEERIPLSSPNPVARAFRSKQVLLINEGDREPHWMDWPRKQAIYAWIGAPLTVEQAVVGVLTVDRYFPDRPYGEEEAGLLQAFANQAALAVNNARLYEALQASEARFRTVSELTSDYAYSVRVEPDQVGILEWFTPTFTRETGHTLKRRGEQMLREIIVHPEDQAIVRERMERLLANQEVVTEYRILTTQGETRWLRDYGRPIWDAAAGRVVRIISAAQDITEQKQAEQALSESEQRYRLLAEHSYDGVALFEGGRLVYISPAYERIHGHAVEQLLGLDYEGIMNLVHPDDRKWILRLDRSAPVQKYAFRFKHREGHYVWVEDVVRRTFDEQGRLLRTTINTREISERKALEEQLYQSQKMEALGRLAGGVAHHFNNMLTAIIGFIELAMANLPASHPAVEDLNQAHASSLQAASITHQLVAFTRHQVVQPMVFDLNTLVVQGQTLLARLIPISITLVTNLSPDAGQVKIDRGQFEQLLVNLVVNGCEAMPEGGQLTIETANVFAGEAEGLFSPELPSGSYVQFTVRDTGVGIRKDIQTRIFEPFFTTKEVGQGTGLGLSVCYGIVKQHGGEIRVESQLSQGATFHVYLPRM